MKRTTLMMVGLLALAVHSPAFGQALSADQVTGQPGAIQATAADGKRIKVPVWTPVRADGTIIDAAGASGAGAMQEQGTAPNGGTPTGNPNLVAGSDGTNVRTVLTGTNGALRVGLGGASAAQAVSGAAGSNGANLLGVGPLGLTSSSAGAVAAGIYTPAWYGLKGQQIIGTGPAYVYGGGSMGNAANAFMDPDGTTRPLLTVGGVFDGTNYYGARTAVGADKTTGDGLTGAGILGQFQTTLPTYTAGQFGTLAMSSNGILSVSLTSATGGAIGIGQATDAQSTLSGLSVRSQPQMYDPAGLVWNRVRGDTTGGLYTQERERSQYFAEATTALAANATFTGATRDGGVSPSQWGSFSCFIRSDQTGNAALQGSTDNVTWYSKVTAAVTANIPVRMTDRNDTRYSRCTLLNGSTANAFSPPINSSFGQ